MSARRCDLSPLFFYSLKTFRQRSGTSRGHGWALHDDLIDGATNYGTVEVFSPRLIFRTRIVVRFLDRIRHRSSRLHLENCPSATTRTNDYMVLTWYSLRDLVYSFHPHIAPLLPPSPQARKKKQKKNLSRHTWQMSHTGHTHTRTHTHIWMLRYGRNLFTPKSCCWQAVSLFSRRAADENWRVSSFRIKSTTARNWPRRLTLYFRSLAKGDEWDGLFLQKNKTTQQQQLFLHFLVAHDIKCINVTCI